MVPDGGVKSGWLARVAKQGAGLRLLSRNPLKASGILLILLGVYYALVNLGWVPFREICRKGEYGPPDDCAYDDLLFFAFLRIFHFVDDHNGLFVAIFTGVLWWSTHKLWEAGEIQGKNNKALTGAARISADAATKAADSASESVKLLAMIERAYLTLGFDDLIDAGEISGVEPGGRQINFTIMVGNGGRTAGILKKFWMGMDLIEPSLPHPVYKRGQVLLTMDQVVSAGAKIKIGDQRLIVRKEIFVFGFVEYEDVFRNPRVSRFCAKIVADPIEFGAAGPPAWNDWT